MVSREVDRQPIHGRLLLMHAKAEEAPYCFWCTNITCVQVVFDLIGNLNSGAVGSFVHIFVNVLDCTNSETELGVAMGLDAAEEIPV
jgi:hypothetical protein